MRTDARWAALFAVLLMGVGGTLGCGGGGGGGGVTAPGPSGPMSARIDGVAWTSDPIGSGLAAFHTSPGLYTISGRKASGSVQFLDLTLHNIAGVGTYPLGVNATNFGGGAIVGNATAGFGTPLSGSAGTVTITVLDSSRIAGTFAFTATPLTGAAVGTRVVSEGSFDYPVSTIGAVGPVPDHAGSQMRALIDGASWNGATIATVYNTGGATPFLVVGASTLDRQLNITATGISGPGSYPIAFSPQRLVTWSELGTSRVWGGSGMIVGSEFVSSDSGVVVIASLSTTRIRGTFSGKLAPGPGSTATGFKYITNGEFDCGLPQPGAR